MALSKLWVDPAVAGPGAGTEGDPHASTEYAILNNAFGAGGTQINLKTGTDDVLAAQLDAALITAGWTPSEATPLVIRGYATAENDGGQGQLDGGGLVSIISTTRDFISLIDLKMGNTGANIIASLDSNGMIIRCESHTCTGTGFQVASYGVIKSCYLHHACAVNRSGLVLSGAGAVASFNHVALTGAAAGNGIYASSIGTRVEDNIIIMPPGVGTSAMSGINSIEAYLVSNSIYSAAAHVGVGINNVINSTLLELTNNLIEGFSGIGGKAVSHAANTSVRYQGGNAYFNCASGFDAPANHVIMDLGDNETLSASPFEDASTGDFRSVNTGNVRAGALPNIIGGGLVP